LILLSALAILFRTLIRFSLLLRRLLRGSLRFPLSLLFAAPLFSLLLVLILFSTIATPAPI
jgi:hypothetical protein